MIQFEFHRNIASLSKFTLSMSHDQGSSKVIYNFFGHGLPIAKYDHETRGGGVHSHIFLNYVRTNIGFTSKLQPTSYKTYACNKDLYI